MRKLNAKNSRFVVIQSYDPNTKTLSDKFDKVIPLPSNKMVEVPPPLYFRKTRKK